MPETTKTIVRSRRCGLKDLYLAPVTTNTPEAYAAGTPVKFARAVTAKISDKYTTETVYSDDGTEEVVTTYQGTEIELEVNALAPQDRALVYDRMYKEGYLLESAEDQPKPMALGFRAKQLNGKYEFVWYYIGTFGEGQDEEFETIGDKKNHKTAGLSGRFYERAKVEKTEAGEKHLFRIRVDESNLAEDATQAKEAIGKWFEAVQEYAPSPAAAHTEEGHGV